MFDNAHDKEKNNLNKGESAPSPIASKGTVDSKSGSDDIFSNIEESSGNEKTRLNRNGIEKPRAFLPKEKTSREEFSVETAEDAIPIPERKTKGLKKLILFLTILIALTALLAAGYYFYPRLADLKARFQSLPLENPFKKENPENNALPEANNEDNGMETPENGGNNIFSEERDSVGKEKDTDQDGVSDDEEISKGMDVNSNDGDQDGLFDREEIRVYKTDPLKSDTDSDGFSDGDEVEGGYDPLGAGKLYDLE